MTREVPEPGAVDVVDAWAAEEPCEEPTAAVVAEKYSEVVEE